jgi:hypothetical protein
LGERDAQNHQIGVPDGGQQIGGGKIHRTRPLTILQAGATTDETRDLAREFPAFDSQSDGTAEQADADDGDFLKQHGWKIAGGRRFVNR